MMPVRVYVIGEKPTKPHPEQKLGEVFLTNCNADEPDDFDNIGYQSKRAGTTAYDETGQVILHYFPVFVFLAEYNIVNKEVKIGQ